MLDTATRGVSMYTDAHHHHHHHRAHDVVTSSAEANPAGLASSRATCLYEMEERPLSGSGSVLYEILSSVCTMYSRVP